MDIHIDTQHFDIYDELAGHDYVLAGETQRPTQRHHPRARDLSEEHAPPARQRRSPLYALHGAPQAHPGIQNRQRHRRCNPQRLAGSDARTVDFRSKRRGLDKQRLKAAKSGPRLSGQVVHVAPEQGYGYVDIGADEEIHFLRNVVVGDAFEMINEGAAVAVDVVESGPGYEATRVALLQG